MSERIAYLKHEGRNFATVWRKPNKTLLCHVLKDNAMYTAGQAEFTQLVVKVSKKYELDLIVVRT